MKKVIIISLVPPVSRKYAFYTFADNLPQNILRLFGKSQRNMKVENIVKTTYLSISLNNHQSRIYAGKVDYRSYTRLNEDVTNPSYPQKRRCEVQSALSKGKPKVSLISS